MIEMEDPFISEEEAAQYDRQIRLWGLDAQKRFVSLICSSTEHLETIDSYQSDFDDSVVTYRMRYKESQKFVMFAYC